VVSEKYHTLLTSRFVCENCLTRYFTPHTRCPACLLWDRIRPLTEGLIEVANTDEELREIIARGQQVLLPESPPEDLGQLAEEALGSLPLEWLSDLPPENPPSENSPANE
jgi:hypothetical protein